MIAAIFCFAMGAILVLSGWRHWRMRDVETITVLEAGIQKVTGVQPLPRSRLDRALSNFHAAMGLILGLFFLFAGLCAILLKLGVL